MRKHLVLTMVCLIAVASVAIYAGKTIAGKLETKYFAALDGWVQQGGQVKSYSIEVEGICEKLVLASETLSEAVLLPTIHKDEFVFRVKVCAKTTVHRVHPQPELNDPELVHEICDDEGIPLLKKLCRRSGLR